MFQKHLSILLVGLSFLATGCCCGPQARVWTSDMADCGDGPCGGCGNGGVRGLLVGHHSACKGCGEVYRGEWLSDPPPCVDPCANGSCGTGSCGGCGDCGVDACHGACLSGLFGWARGYRQYPGPCGTGDCGGCSSGGCTDGSCSSCGISGANPRASRAGSYGGGLLQEDWNPTPAPAPIPGKPIHKAQVPSGTKLSQRGVLGARPANSAGVRQASYAR